MERYLVFARREYDEPLAHQGEIACAACAIAQGRSAGTLKGEIRRNAGRHLGDLVESFNRLTALRGEDLADACAPGALVPAVARGIARFGESYLVRAGWREGGIGLCLALLCGLYPVVAHLKARETLKSRLRAVANPAVPALHAEPARAAAR